MPNRLSAWRIPDARATRHFCMFARGLRAQAQRDEIAAATRDCNIRGCCGGPTIAGYAAGHGHKP